MGDALWYLGKMVTRGTQLACLYFSSSRSGGFDDFDDRIYTKLSAERVAELAKDHREAGGRVDVHSITAEEVLEQTNKVFAPYKVSFASPLSWFAVWKSQSSFPFSHHSQIPKNFQTDIPSLRASRTLLLFSGSPSPPRRRRSVSDLLPHPLNPSSH